VHFAEMGGKACRINNQRSLGQIRKWLIRPAP
jgi:hypothetical protein